jgi:hypothetical protein
MDARENGKWSSVLVTLVMGMLIFEALTGLSIYFLPFSVPNQIMVLLHAAIGIAFLVPATIYSAKHWIKYKSSPMSHYKLTGYASLLVLAVCSVSGVVVTYQALLATRMSPTWDLIHLVSTFLVIAGAGVHIVLLLIRKVAGQAEKAAQRQFVVRMGTSIILGAVLVAAGMLAVPDAGLVYVTPTVTIDPSLRVSPIPQVEQRSTRDDSRIPSPAGVLVATKRSTRNGA